MSKVTTEIVFQNILHDLLLEVSKSPEDNLQEIANEILERWEVGWYLNNSYQPTTIRSYYKQSYL